MHKVQSHGGRDAQAPPAGMKSVLELKASAGCTIDAERGADDELRSAVQQHSP